MVHPYGEIARLACCRICALRLSAVSSSADNEGCRVASMPRDPRTRGSERQTSPVGNAGFPGADNVNSADGFFSNLNPPTTVGITDGLLALYAVKHDPFAYFADIEAGDDPRLSLKNVVGFDGSHGLFAELAQGHLPDLVYIVPNQCNDQHGRSGGGPECDFDPNDVGTLTGLNPGLMYQGDVTLERLVTAITASPAWKHGHSAIVVVWYENDYSTRTSNQVVLIVDTNYGPHGLKSGRFYTHYALTKTLDGALRLPCLNHACDPGVEVMSDLFKDQDDRQ